MSPSAAPPPLSTLPPAPPSGPALAPQQVEQALLRIERSAAFRGSPRHRSLLRHLVTRALHNDLGALKETVIAVEVFGRPVASFDPKLDTIVRVEARRLRGRLARYYGGDGQQAPLRIELPVGSYVPLIAHRPDPQRQPDATRRARDLVERGEHFLRQALSQTTLEQALQRFDAALRESPDFAPAYVGLGRAWFNLGSAWHVEPSVAMAHASEALQHALQLDAQNAVAHTLMGAIEHQYHHNWPAAQQRFVHALALAPQQGFVHSAYGWHLCLRSEFEHAERELLLARHLDPHYPTSRNHMVNLRIMQGRLADAEAEIQALQDITPPTLSIVGLRGALAMYRGDAASAIQHYQQVHASASDVPGPAIALATALAMAGQHEEADALVAHTLAQCAGQPLSPYLLAIFYTRRGHIDAAFAHLDRALSEFDPLAMQIPHEPTFADLRDDPRWAVLVNRPALQRP